MTGAMQSSRSRHRQKRLACRLVAGSSLAAFSILVAGWTGGLRVNLTPSEPMGLWRVLPLDRPTAVGDVVFICPPETRTMQFARERGYLRSGLCPAGYAPLIKTVVGVGGQRADVGQDVQIDGHPIPHSDVVTRDGEGRPLSSFGGGVIPAGHVFLHSNFSGSFDSRYFGPIPASGVLGLAQKVWIYAP